MSSNVCFSLFTCNPLPAPLHPLLLLLLLIIIIIIILILLLLLLFPSPIPLHRTAAGVGAALSRNTAERYLRRPRVPNARPHSLRGRRRPLVWVRAVERRFRAATAQPDKIRHVSIICARAVGLVGGGADVVAKRVCPAKKIGCAASPCENAAAL